MLFLHTSGTWSALLIVGGLRFRGKPAEEPYQDLKAETRIKQADCTVLSLFLIFVPGAFSDSMCWITPPCQQCCVMDLPSRTQVAGDTVGAVQWQRWQFRILSSYEGRPGKELQLSCTQVTFALPVMGMGYESTAEASLHLSCQTLSSGCGQ